MTRILPRLLLRASLIATILCLASSVAQAQYKVHALSGTVNAVHPRF